MRMRLLLKATALLCLLWSQPVSAATVTLAWDRNSEPDIIGYRISYGTQPGVYTVVHNVGNNVSWTGEFNTPGRTTYYFVVQAYNSAGVSPYSNSVSTTVTVSNGVTVVDRPATGSVHPTDVFLSGWAIDAAAPTGTGVDAVHVYAYPNPGSSTPPVFLGLAAYGGSRPDVGAAYGARYTDSGYSMPIVGLSPGTFRLAVFAHSSFSDSFFPVRTVDITVVNPPPNNGRGLVNIDLPATGQTLSGIVSIGGWAIDQRSTSGAGMDVVQIWAYRSPGSGTAPVFLGNAQYGATRNDVAAMFGTRFRQSGFYMDVVGMQGGVYDFVVLARSTVSGGFEVARIVRVVVDPQVLVNIDAPALNSSVGSPFILSGWSIDRRATSDAGIDTLHIWAYPNPGSGNAPVWIGAVGVGDARPDVATAFGGAQFTNSGFNTFVSSLTPGVYDIVVFGHSSVSSSFENAATVRVTVQ